MLTQNPSISEIASSNLPDLTKALSDEKIAKSLLAACKSFSKNGPPPKRPAPDPLSPSSKRLKSQFSLYETPQIPQELEKSLELPAPSTDEEAIEKCMVYTNRAPLVLAFAVQLLRYTMPEQPLSGRLSLAQAVVSVNSRGKAQSLGIREKEEGEGWGSGQPRVRVMGREVGVLKRSGYEWKEEEGKVEKEVKVEVPEESQTQKDEVGQSQVESSASTMKNEPNLQPSNIGWTVSSPITSKKSTFIARSIPITSTQAASQALTSLLPQDSLASADHNISAYRILTSQGSILDSCSDDGETGGGNHLLSILKSSNLTNVLLVVSRWYGGIMLGTDRWRIMTDVSRDALSQRLRVSGVLGREALWGLDMEGLEKGSDTGSLPVHRPEGARSYILKSFLTPPSPASEGTASKSAEKVNGETPSKKAKKKKTQAQMQEENAKNLGMLLGALDMLFTSWAQWLSKEELDRRAWGWYVAVRPDVQDGIAGWGGKGVVKLGDILALRRRA